MHKTVHNRLIYSRPDQIDPLVHFGSTKVSILLGSVLILELYQNKSLFELFLIESFKNQKFNLAIQVKLIKRLFNVLQVVSEVKILTFCWAFPSIESYFNRLGIFFSFQMESLWASFGKKFGPKIFYSKSYLYLC